MATMAKIIKDYEELKETINEKIKEIVKSFGEDNVVVLTDKDAEYLGDVIRFPIKEIHVDKESDNLYFKTTSQFYNQVDVLSMDCKYIILGRMCKLFDII